ncbi:MAG TPA: hypothetical protein VLM76_04765 [Patescibacteria group bacterium]|nr:hypothetical protein [Patescibacteria group bacterium]
MMMIERLHDGSTPVRGVVTVEARDAAGRLVERRTFRNTYLHLAATEHAKALVGEAASLTLTHIGLGCGGATFSDGESATGWTGAPTVDGTTFRQGTASLRATAGASTTTTCVKADAFLDYNASGATAIELWLRLALRGRFNLATSELRIYTGGGTSTYFRASLTAIETANGVAFQDATWKQSRVPIASFGIGAGAPDWAHVTGMGIIVAANASGSATLNWDAARTIEPINTTATAAHVPNEPTRRALTTLTRAGRVVTAAAFWTMYEAVDQYYVAGLYAGSTLVSILPFAYYKAAGLTLRVTWALTTNGG